MINKIKKLAIKKLSDMEKFEDEKVKTRQKNDHLNNKFSKELNEKVTQSQNRIESIRRSIQNTKQ